MKDYTDIRQLALHRIHSAEATNDAINRPKDFDVDAYIASGAFGILDSDRNLKLVANFAASAAAHLYETPLSTDQQLQGQEDGSVKLTATVKDTLEICWWLLAFGDQVEVLGPAKLRKKMAEMVKRMSEKYA